MHILYTYITYISTYTHIFTDKFRYIKDFAQSVWKADLRKSERATLCPGLNFVAQTGKKEM